MVTLLYTRINLHVQIKAPCLSFVEANKAFRRCKIQWSNMKEACLTLGLRKDHQSELLPMSLQVEGRVRLDIRGHHRITPQSPQKSGDGVRETDPCLVSH